MGADGDLSARGAALEEALAALLYDERARAELRAGVVADPLFRALDPAELDEAAGEVRRLIRGRTHRGSGGPEAWYPQTIAAFGAAVGAAFGAARAGQDEDHLEILIARFCASRACAMWREGPGGDAGISLEEALYRFFCDDDIGDPAVREEEFVGALLRGLAVTPRARFVRPAEVRVAPGGCFAVTRAGVLHAALDGRYVRGPVTPLVAALLAGATNDDIAASSGASNDDIERVRAALRQMRLVD